MKIGEYEVSPEVAQLNPQAFEGGGNTAAVVNKYHSKRVTVEGRTFDSGREAVRAGELVLLHQNYQIFALAFQVAIPLPGAGKYVADFFYLDDKLRPHFEDAKGFKTDTYKLKKKQVENHYGIKIEEV